MVKKVAVVNRTTLKNYGSVLQSYALCQAIKNIGYDSEIIWQTGAISKNNDFRPGKIVKTLFRLMLHPSLWKKTLQMAKGAKAGDSQVVSDKTLALFDDFVGKNINRKFLSKKEMKRYAESDECHKLVCGSDQVWCSTTLYVDPLMYLRFAPREKRVAYAPSIGRSYIPGYNKKIMRKYINGIDNVSVRETEGARLIKELTDRDVPVVLDPTLIIDKEQWQSLAVSPQKEKYLLCYFLSDVTAETQNKIAELAKERGLKIVALKTRLFDIENTAGVEYPDAGPAEFLGLVRGADAVITDSYHGMLFSLIFEKQFYSLHRQSKDYDQSTRQKSVLAMLGLSDRYVMPGEDFIGKMIDYQQAGEVLDDKRKKSLEYLATALHGD